MSDVVNVDGVTFDSVIVHVTGVGEKGDKGDPGESPSTADLDQAVAFAQEARTIAEDAAEVAQEAADSIIYTRIITGRVVGDGVIDAIMFEGEYTVKGDFFDVYVGNAPQGADRFDLVLSGGNTYLTFGGPIPLGLAATGKVVEKVIAQVAVEDQITDLSVKTVASRAAALAWIAGHAVPKVGFVLRWWSLPVVAVGCALVSACYAGAGLGLIDDMPGFRPAVEAHPDHFKSNSDPGTTNMSPAFQEAFDRGLKVYLLENTSYGLSTGVTITQQGTGIVGRGYNSVLVRRFVSGDLVTAADPDGPLLGIEFDNFRIDSVVGSTLAGAAILMDGCRSSSVSKISITRGLIGLHLKGCGQSTFTDSTVIFSDDNGGLIAGRKFILIEETANANITTKHPGGLLISNFNGRCGTTEYCEYGFEIHSADGIWVINSHFGSCTESNLRIIADRTARCTGIRFVNCWFDVGVGDGAIIEGGTPTLNGPFNFTTCKFLGGGSGRKGFIHAGAATNVMLDASCEISGYLQEGLHLPAGFTGSLKFANSIIRDVGLGGLHNAVNYIGPGYLKFVRNDVIGDDYLRPMIISGNKARAIIEDNDVPPGTTGAMSPLSGVDTSSIISQERNRGYNPVGRTNQVVGASPWTFTNDKGFRVELFVTGGTVSEISRGGQATGITSGSLIVHPGGTVTITYSATPTVRTFGL